MMCYACSGSGKVTCSNCNGQGSSWTHVGAKPVWQPCFACGGRRTVTCPTCGGTGQLGGPVHVGNPGPAPLLPPVPLDGPWKGPLGDSYTFTPDGPGFRVQHIVLGMKVDEGTASQNGNEVTLDLKNFLGFSVSGKLQMNGNRMEGALMAAGSGLTSPIVLFKL